MFIQTILLAILCVCIHGQTQVILPPLPYAYNALEPVLSEHALRLHYEKHFQAYTNRTNIALRALFNTEKFQEIAQKPIEVILTQLSTLPDQFHVGLRYNGGGYINHKFFFSTLRTPSATVAENRPTGPLLEAIVKSFGSFEKFQELFSAASVNLMGSGWVWIYIDARTKHLVLNFTANQDNP